MLHFVKNEDEVKITIAYGDSKWEASLDTTNEAGKNFYELLKEKKTIELTFNYNKDGFPMIETKHGFKLIDDDTEIPVLTNFKSYHIIADNANLGIFYNNFDSSIAIAAFEIGKLIGTPESLSNLASLPTEESPFKFVFSLDENQKETSNYNIDLLFLISSIIIIILLFVCLLSFLTK